MTTAYSLYDNWFFLFFVIYITYT